ncbi:MAG: septation protein A [Legionellales bacterium]|nr:septation protein A [Legionellales bacterium]|tara:strand:+ start:428 stop:988 length:561 start_codon:yes stop_codon:yes gene_type:complete
MKFLFDFFPLVAFLVAFYYPEDREQGIYLGIQAMIIASAIQIIVYWLMTRKFEKMHVITLILTVILGGATFYFQDMRFFKWKPTAVNWIFALVFIGSHFIGKKPIIRRMMDHAISVPNEIWSKLNLAWAGFFIFAGAINLYIAYNFSTEFWVNFKVYGLLGLTFIFAIAQAIYISRYIKDVKEEIK